MLPSAKDQRDTSEYSLLSEIRTVIGTIKTILCNVQTFSSSWLLQAFCAHHDQDLLGKLKSLAIGELLPARFTVMGSGRCLFERAGHPWVWVFASVFSDHESLSLLGRNKTKQNKHHNQNLLTSNKPVQLQLLCTFVFAVKLSDLSTLQKTLTLRDIVFLRCNSLLILMGLCFKDQ